MMTLPVLLICLHWFGDFFCQNDWMAVNKSKNWLALSSHVGIYTIVLGLGLLLFGYSNWALYAVINGGLHFVIDAITSRINARLYANHRHWFFTSIGFDQVLHYLCLFYTAYLLTL